MKTRIISLLVATLMIASAIIVPTFAEETEASTPTLAIAGGKTVLQTGTNGITFEFSGLTVNSNPEWITIYERSVWDNGNISSINKQAKYIDWMPCSSTESGSVTFPSNVDDRMDRAKIWPKYGSLPDGEYTAVLYLDYGYSVALATYDFEVYSPVYMEKTSIEYKEDYTFNVRYKEGETKTAKDYIGIWGANIDSYSSNYTDYAYENNNYKFPTYISSRNGGKATPVGEYKALFMQNDSYTPFYGAPFHFTVNPKITASSTTIYVGESVDIYCGTGLEDSNDWLGIYDTSTNGGYIDWLYVTNIEGEHTFPSSHKSVDWGNKPGVYEVFYYYNSDRNTWFDPNLKITVTDQPAVLNGETLTVYKSSGFDLASIEAPEKEGYIFTGWADENGEYPESTYVTCKAGTVYTATYEEFVAEEKAPVKGAQIRLTTGSADLRYVSSIDKALLTSLGITEFYGENVKFGTLMLPLDRLSDGEELTKDTADVGIIPAVKKIEETDAEITFTACLINIYKQNYDRVFAVRPYIEYTDGNGVAHTIYGQTYGSAEEGASLYKVALELKAEMGDEAPEVVNNIISAVETAE